MCQLKRQSFKGKLRPELANEDLLLMNLHYKPWLNREKM
jgi:hypothetical protein